MASETVKCEDAQLMLKSVPELHDAVSKLKDVIASEYIDPKRERKALEEAEAANERVQTCRQRLETLLDSEDAASPLVQHVRSVLSDVSQCVSDDSGMLQRMEGVVTRREDEYNSTNVIARQFLSPRTQFRQAWEKEERQGPSAHPEANFLVVTLIVFAALVIGALVSTKAVRGRLAEIAESVVDGGYAAVQIVKRTVVGGVGSGAQVAANVTKTDL